MLYYYTDIFSPNSLSWATSASDLLDPALDAFDHGHDGREAPAAAAARLPIRSHAPYLVGTVDLTPKKSYNLVLLANVEICS